MIFGILISGNDTRPFGLCCYNGCANKCLKKPCVLATNVVTECNPVMEPECKDIEVGGFQEIILQKEMVFCYQNCLIYCEKQARKGFRPVSVM